MKVRKGVKPNLNNIKKKQTNWQAISDKIYSQEGNNPDQKIRSQSIS